MMSGENLSMEWRSLWEVPNENGCGSSDQGNAEERAGCGIVLYMADVYPSTLSRSSTKPDS